MKASEANALAHPDIQISSIKYRCKGVNTTFGVLPNKSPIGSPYCGPQQKTHLVSLVIARAEATRALSVSVACTLRASRISASSWCIAFL